LRFGAGPAGARYPLPVAGALDWTPVEGHAECYHYRATIELANLQPGELLLPSLILPGTLHYAYTCSLSTQATDGSSRQWSLAPIATRPDLTTTTRPAPAQGDNAVTTHIDLFAIHTALPECRLQIELQIQKDRVTAPAKWSAPADYLLVISRRPKQIPASPPRAVRAEHEVAALSQMTQPASQRQRTCSPTSLAMVMATHGESFQPAFVDDCLHTPSSMYGVWPLNIVQSGRRGFTAAVELISSWEALADMPLPFVASITFASGELQGAPLGSTAGHLVVVRGTTSTHVLCNDPAAASVSEVAREYSLQEFSRAWLADRGAAYILAPLHGPAATGVGG